MTNNSLIVPIQLHSLVLNNASLQGEKSFQRWTANYNNLLKTKTPIPTPFSSTSNFNNPKNKGSYIYWELPDAIRHGINDPTSGFNYPLTPNRFFVVRSSGPSSDRKLVAWIVDSDFTDPNKGSSAFLDPNSDVSSGFSEKNITSIGQKLVFDGSWKESNMKDLFLTAIGTGDVSFSSYQPYINNVFSIHDDLSDSIVQEKDNLSYYVFGWYSNESDDFIATLRGNDSFTALLEKLNWSVTQNDQTANQSLYQGVSCNIAWDVNGPIPPSDINNADPKLAIGNNSIDALTALLKSQDVDNDENLELLEAFQYNQLNNLNQPNGKALLDQASRNSWFGSSNSGTSWIISNKNQDDTKSAPQTTSCSDITKENTWLSKLNKDQSQLDAEKTKLLEMQQNLYAMYWKSKRAVIDSQEPTNYGKYPVHCTQSDFESALNVSDPSSLAGQVKTQIALVQSLSQNVPHGLTQKELLASIAVFATKKGLSKNKILKPKTASRYWSANDPVILLSGVKSSSKIRTKALPSRFANQITTTITISAKEFDFNNIALPPFNVIQSSSDSYSSGSATAKIGSTISSLTGLPSLIHSLLKESFILDSANSNYVASKIGVAQSDLETAITSLIKNIPELDYSAWSQPWLPLYMEWEISYYPLDYQENIADFAQSWQFNGTDYSWNGKNNRDWRSSSLTSRESVKTYLGRTILTPQNQFYLQNSLNTYLKNHPNPDLEKINQWIEQIDDWDFLSQSLSGLHSQLATRDPAIYLQPTEKDIADLIKTNAKYGATPNYIAVDPGIPYQKISCSPPIADFYNVCAGQIAFLSLSVIDRFGQNLEVVINNDQAPVSKRSSVYAPVISEAMKPSNPVSKNPQRFVELAPRIMQDAKLDFLLIDKKSDEVVNPTNLTNPVAGWILPNHLDQALSIFDESGTYLGEIYPTINTQKQSLPQWHAAYDQQNYQDLSNLITINPMLGNFIESITKKSLQDFENFFSAIDSTMWSTDPLGERKDQNLSILIGRPLALVKSRLQLTLKNGAALSDPSWTYTFPNSQNPHTIVKPYLSEYDFTIRLGDLETRNDGLIGYFLNNSYDAFFAVETDSTSGYVTPIGNGNINLKFDNKSQIYASMLIDPRGSVHATSGFLPVKNITVPSSYIDSALKNMEVIFRIDPLLTKMDTSLIKETSTIEDFIQTPIPSEKNGDWSWIENDSGTYKTMSIKSIDQKAKINSNPASIRSGWLKLTQKTKN